MKSSKIKISELFFFFSTQGEGRHMGVPSIFLRTFGCNFTCDGFGMPPGQKSQERHIVAQRANEFKEYKDLPLTKSGCDSYASWMPELKHLSPVLTVDAVTERIQQLLPYREWRDEHLVITGGEPLLGWQRAYPELLDHTLMQPLRELTFETNGTQPLEPKFAEYLEQWGIEQRGYNALTFSVSPKLSCSGEARLDAIKPTIVCDYQRLGYTYLKFVVATEEDVDEALETISVYRHHGFKGVVYLMPEGGVEETHSLNRRRVADLALANGLRYSARLQVDIYKNAWGT